jgi:hypothetical protein
VQAAVAVAQGEPAAVVRSLRESFDRRGYIEVTKKNGKSALFSGLSLYLLMAEGEPGEVGSSGG